MFKSNRVLFLSVVTMFQVLSLSAFAAAPEDFSPAALDCYEKTIQNPNVFTKNKDFKTQDAVEKLVVSLCTYSDAEGATKCYEQARDQDEVLAGNKNFVNVFLLEQKYARLCSNSRAAGLNKATGDIDAVDCIKAVMQDPEVLVGAKAYSDAVKVEDLATKLCISSKGKGATSCYKKALAGEALKSSKNYKGPAALDQIVVDLCKATRIR
jgi:hypothetical protein